MFHNYFLVTELKALLNKRYFNNTFPTPALCSHFFENTKNDEYVINTWSDTSESTPMAVHKKHITTKNFDDPSRIQTRDRRVWAVQN